MQLYVAPDAERLLKRAHERTVLVAPVPVELIRPDVVAAAHAEAQFDHGPCLVRCAAVTNANGPLAGIRVVDLTRVLAGPYCTMVLSDLGADVVKVEHPRGGDDSRHIGPFINGISAYFASLNRGKQSVALDLKVTTDRERFEGLLVDADVLVENFRPGTMEKLGYGWEELHPRFPRLVYAAVSGFGHTGPLASRPAYDMVVQAMGGVMSITGQPGGAPTRVGTSIGDLTAGLFTAIGVCSALFERERTGEAAKIDVAMLDCQVAILENAIARYAATGEVPRPLGARHPSITPFAAFEAQDGWFVIAAGNDMLFRRLCDVIGRPEVADDPRFATNALRTQHHSELQAELERALRTTPWPNGWLGSKPPICRAVRSTTSPRCSPIRKYGAEHGRVRRRRAARRTRNGGESDQEQPPPGCLARSRAGPRSGPALTRVSSNNPDSRPATP